MSSLPPYPPPQFRQSGDSHYKYAPGPFSLVPERAMHVQRPGVVNWYIAYCFAMALLYALCVAGGGLLLVFQEPIMDEIARDGENPLIVRVYGFLLLGMGIPLCLFFAAGPMIKRGKAAWIYGIVAIVFGMTSAFCLPITIPLLVFWLRDDTKAYFGV